MTDCALKVDRLPGHFFACGLLLFAISACNVLHGPDDLEFVNLELVDAKAIRDVRYASGPANFEGKLLRVDIATSQNLGALAGEKGFELWGEEWICEHNRSERLPGLSELAGC